MSLPHGTLLGTGGRTFSLAPSNMDKRRCSPVEKFKRLLGILMDEGVSEVGAAQAIGRPSGGLRNPGKGESDPR